MMEGWKGLLLGLFAGRREYVRVCDVTVFWTRGIGVTDDDGGYGGDWAKMDFSVWRWSTG